MKNQLAFVVSLLVCLLLSACGRADFPQKA